MRHLIILRGIPGSGKSHFINQNNLEPYTVSSDEIRLLFQGPIQSLSGGFTISQKNDKQVWEFLLRIVNQRMARGELVIVDATHTKTADLNKYKELVEQHRYRAFCLDFADCNVELAKERNNLRPEYKRVPEEVIDVMNQRIQIQQIPSWLTIVKPENFFEVIKWNSVDFSEYKKIHHFGDLQGCCAPLKEYFEQNPFQDDELYIFVGDYLDRGPENAEVMEYLLELYEKTNCIFLEGNHEAHLIRWANDQPAASKEFENKTKPQLENKKIDKKIVRQFCRKLRQVVYYQYQDKNVLVSHAGIANKPDNLVFIPTQQFIHGVGGYGDALEINTHFAKSQNCYQIHGHRNLEDLPIKINDYCYNLEGKVEFGGCLRIVTLSNQGFDEVEIKNTNCEKSGNLNLDIEINSQNAELITQLRNNQNIKEKKFGRISSFNFSRKVFTRGAWDEQTMRARGLFLNTDTAEIVIRSYDKFFNLEERPETKLENLKNSLKYPLRAYLKENGYLGLLGYNSQKDELVYATKSVLESDHVNWFTEIFSQRVNSENQAKIKQFLRETNTSLVFEVIDPINDPHIIEYQDKEIILLDIIKREQTFQRLEFKELNDFGNKFGLKTKQLSFEFTNQTEFFDWLNKASNDSSNQIEGYVVEDSNEFIFKIKMPYYVFWKRLRSLVEQHYSGKSTQLSEYFKSSELANHFYTWLNSQEMEPTQGIIELRKKFLMNFN